MIKNRLLSNIYFGTELEKLEAGTATSKELLRATSSEFGALDQQWWQRIDKVVREFFRDPPKGQFGGPITAGDSYFIAAYLAALRPRTMIEVGVCSGVSSAFILFAAAEFGLLRDDKTFLYSFDLLKLHGPHKQEVGRVVRMNYPALLKNWQLLTEKTAPDLALSLPRLKAEIEKSAPTLAFIDANHLHPWPLVDVLAISKVLEPSSWVLLQDTQLMERWLANCVELGVPSPKPCRGVNLVLGLWPGTKVIGWDICYNMGAVKLDVSENALQRLSEVARSYPSETDVSEGELCFGYIERLV